MPFAPTDIAGCQIWLAADKITGLNDGDDVTTWTDSSTGGNNASQTTVANKPTYKTGIVNGLPVVRFDGAASYMTIADNANYKKVNITVFVVALKADVATLQLLINYPHDTTHISPFFRWSFLVGSSWQVAHRWNGNDNIGPNNGISANKWVIYELVDNASFLDGASNVSGADADLTYPNAVGIYIGSNVTPDEFWNGDIAEIIFYDSSLSSANRTSVRNYLNSKYKVLNSKIYPINQAVNRANTY